MDTIDVRMRYIVVKRFCGWALFDAAAGQVAANTRCYGGKTSAEAAAYRLNRGRCVNCLDAIKDDAYGEDAR